jgi:uncharacterized protein (TIGR02001 family)
VLGYILTLAIFTSPAQAGQQSWGGAADMTSDYLLRGVSSSDDQPALQLDLHYANSNGLFAGAFASDTVFRANSLVYAELDPYGGYAWQVNEDWRAKILADAYLYPANPAGRRYEYEEVAFAADYHEWLILQTTISPNAPRSSLSQGLIHAHAVSAEVTAQQPVYRQLSAIGGVGIYHLDGTAALDYLYWSVGARVDRSPVSFTFSYIGTSNEAKSLFYNGSGGGRWVGTVSVRF